MTGTRAVLALILFMAVGSNIISLTHNIPDSVEVGNTRTVELLFTDGRAPLTPQTIEVELRSPFNLDVTPDLTEAGPGLYRFTYAFDTEGAYYLTIRANKYGYISYSDSYLIDCVKHHVYLGWLAAFLNSPVTAIILGVGGVALAVYLNSRRAQGKRR
jgi:hypothetical protein